MGRKRDGERGEEAEMGGRRGRGEGMEERRERWGGERWGEREMGREERRERCGGVVGEMGVKERWRGGDGGEGRGGRDGGGGVVGDGEGGEVEGRDGGEEGEMVREERREMGWRRGGVEIIVMKHYYFKFFIHHFFHQCQCLSYFFLQTAKQTHVVW